MDHITLAIAILAAALRDTATARLHSSQRTPTHAPTGSEALYTVNLNVM